jgi:hypothetical protein
VSTTEASGSVEASGAVDASGAVAASGGVLVSGAPASCGAAESTGEDASTGDDASTGTDASGIEEEASGPPFPLPIGDVASAPVLPGGTVPPASVLAAPSGVSVVAESLPPHAAARRRRLKEATRFMGRAR